MYRELYGEYEYWCLGVKGYERRYIICQQAYELQD